MSPTGQKPKPYGSATGYDGTDTELTPSCMSCHKSHGNQNAFGLIYMVGTGTVTEQGDDGARRSQQLPPVPPPGWRPRSLVDRPDVDEPGR